MHDVVVVGAGPGGSATAHYLAQAGADVLLLDRSDFPRDKTCGDGLTPRALRVLADMGILDEVASAGCRVDGYEVIAPNGRATAAPIAKTPNTPVRWSCRGTPWMRPSCAGPLPVARVLSRA
jgi:flavin-dependent dehydrogenase